MDENAFANTKISQRVKATLIPIKAISKRNVNPALLLGEFALLFVVIPMFLFAFGTRFGIYAAVWGAGLYAFFILRKTPGFSLRKLWHGEGWTMPQKRYALGRFLVLAILMALATLILLPEHILRLPLEKFQVWLAVMTLYPVLSVVPQELFFRSFYFGRYGHIMGAREIGVLLNGVLFGFSHIVLNNWVAPLFCTLGGVILAQSYLQHRSLKWAVIEHSLYGCWVFTVGIGWYFFTGNWR